MSLTRSVRHLRMGYKIVHRRAFSAVKNGDSNDAPDIVADKKYDLYGFDSVLQRVANIVINVTERQSSKILQVYPEGNFTKFLAEVPRFSLPDSTRCYI